MVAMPILVCQSHLQSSKLGFGIIDDFVYYLSSHQLTEIQNCPRF